jgi:preprotein translocase subunit SecB
MEQAAHPIALDRIFFTRSIVISIPEHQPANGVDIAPTNQIDVTRAHDAAGQYIATMRSIFNAERDPTAPYSIDMECIGVFTVDERLSAEEAMRGVTITAHSVLYGAIREAVLWITGRQPYGALHLGLSVLRGDTSADTQTK